MRNSCALWNTLRIFEFEIISYHALAFVVDAATNAKLCCFLLKIWILITHLYADCNPQSVESRAKQWFQRKFRSQSQRKQAFELQKEPLQSLHHHRQVWKVSDLPYQSSPSGLTFLPRLCLQKRHLCYVRHQNPQNQKLQTKFSVKTRTISLLEPRS